MQAKLKAGYPPLLPFIDLMTDRQTVHLQLNLSKLARAFLLFCFVSVSVILTYAYVKHGNDNIKTS